MRVDPASINFHGHEWAVVKAYLEECKNSKVSMLINESDHDKSNQIRGALQFIVQLLALESAPSGATNRK